MASYKRGGSQAVRPLADVTVTANTQQASIATALAAYGAETLILHSIIPYVGVEQFELWLNSVAAANITNSWFFGATGAVETGAAETHIYLGAVGGGAAAHYEAWVKISAPIGAQRMFTAESVVVTAAGSMLRNSRQIGSWYDTTSPLDSLAARAPAGTNIVAGSRFRLYGVFSS
jgi:hypothetical protein